jgi:Fe-S cluster biogenesis protein NfuA
VSDLNSVVISEKADGSWQALHTPSGKVAHGLSKSEAEAEMKALLGVNEEGSFDEPITSDRFEGIEKEIAEYLEGPVSDMLASHDGFARLEGFNNCNAMVRLGGGCQGCPASTMTLVDGVLHQLQDEFGEHIVAEITPVP